MLLLGKPIAEEILSETREFLERSSVKPGLGVVLVGENEASKIYVGIKEKRARELGFRFEKHELPWSASITEVIETVRTLNDDPGIHGIIVQLPLPSHLDTDEVISAIDPAKDADGFLGGKPVFPEAMIELSKSAGVPTKGKIALVIANSDRFGKTMTDMLAREEMEAEHILRDGIPDAEEMIRNADFIYSAVGDPGILSRGMFKKGAVVIDGGIAKKDGEIMGDVLNSEDGADIFVSPVPGGVGPVTVACLLRRVAYLANKNPA